MIPIAISTTNSLNPKSTGLVYVFTGDGKGKTSASLGVSIRALAAGMSVAVVQWYKSPDWNISDHYIPQLLNDQARSRFAVYPMGEGFYINSQSQSNASNHKTAILSNGTTKVIDFSTPEDHHQAAVKAYSKALSLLNHVDLLVLDEVNNAISDKLIAESKILNLILKRGKTHLIISGRNAPPAIITQADLVTNMTKIKHPYDKGKLAVKGLDF